MKKLVGKLVPGSLVLLSLLASLPGHAARAQAQKTTNVSQKNQSTEAVAQQLTTDQVRGRVQQLMGERLRSRDGKMKTGWQKAYTSPNGTNFYAYVRGGRVVDSAFGDEKMGALLVRVFPNGLGDATASGRRPVAHDGGNGPTRDQCVKKLLDCINKMTSSILARYNDASRYVIQNLSDVGPPNSGTQSVDICLGAACKKVLGID